MTDTLADSRTSSRTFTEGVPLVVEDVPRRPATERAEMLADPGFGRYFTDRMFVARYRAGQGWYDARLTPYAPLQMDPATAALHYAQSIFEGLKAYAQPDGSVATFRPGGQRRPLRPGRPAAGDAGGARGGVPRRRRRAGRRRPRLGAHRRRPDAVPAAVHARQRAVPRRAAGPRVPVPGHRQPGRRLLPARRRSRSRSTSPRTTSAPRPGAPATSSAPATTRPACWPRSRPSRPAATRWSGSTRSRSATSRRWAG